MFESANQGVCYPILRDRKSKFTDCTWRDDDDQLVLEDNGETICIDNAILLDNLGFAELPSTNFFVGTCEIPAGGTKTVGRGTPYALRVMNPFTCVWFDDNNVIVTTDEDEVICLDNAN